MIQTLNYKAASQVAGGECYDTVCPDGFRWKGCGGLPSGCDKVCCGHDTSPESTACSCLDYNDRAFPGPSAETMNDCWENCCVNGGGGYHAAKFGKYPRDC
jgi:hypothetical protein